MSAISRPTLSNVCVLNFCWLFVITSNIIGATYLCDCDAFVVSTFSIGHHQLFSSTTTATNSALKLHAYDSNNNNNNNIYNDGGDINFKKQQYENLQNQILTEALILDKSSSSVLNNAGTAGNDRLVPMELIGQTRITIQNSTDKEILLVLSQQKVTNKNNDNVNFPTSSVSALLVPIPSRNELKILSYAVQNKKVSKSILLSLNQVFVNRQDGLYDNLPWSTWTIDPQYRNYDAANNPIDAKFHLGKRDAYNLFLGKDWKGRSASIGNMAQRLQYMLEQEEEEEEGDNGEIKSQNTKKEKQQEQKDKMEAKILAQRLLQLQISEWEMELAEIESFLAIARTNPERKENEMQLLTLQQEELQNEINQAKQELQELIGITTATNQNTKSTNKFLSQLLTRVVSWSTTSYAYNNNTAPYRGAIGYAPWIDSKSEMFQESYLPYSSPYELLQEIIAEQLNANVIGCVLENTSWLQGNIALGGAIVLQRKTSQKTITLAGEQVTMNNPEDTKGNLNVEGGSTIVVECHADEAIAMSKTCNVPLTVESNIIKQASVMVETSQSSTSASNNRNLTIWELLPMFTTTTTNMTIQVEGSSAQTSSSILPISIPRTTTALFDSMFNPSNNNNNNDSSARSKNTPMFPTDNPIQSLSQYDELSNRDKAKTLLQLSNFNGKLPRPRVVRQQQKQEQKSNQNSNNLLDDLLLPLIDESVRNQYLLRQAKENGDVDLVRVLESKKSKRQILKEQQQQQQQQQSNGKTKQQEEDNDEIKFLESLRADITQDEGSYNRFLDRDEWYERERQATVKRMKRSSFGTLLDGIE